MTKYVGPAPSDPQDVATKGYVDDATNPIIYADLAALDSVLSTESGLVFVSDLGDWTGVATFNGISSWVSVETLEGSLGATFLVSQTATAGLAIGMSREYVGTAWGAWRENHPVYVNELPASGDLLTGGVGPGAGHVTTVPSATAATPSTVVLRNASGQVSVADPTDPAHAATMDYVDAAVAGAGGALPTYADMAALDAIVTTQLGFIRFDDLGASVGIDDFDGYPAEGTIKTSVSFNTAGTFATAYQRFEAGIDDYDDIVISRVRQYDSGSWDTWSDWSYITSPRATSPFVTGDQIATYDGTPGSESWRKATYSPDTSSTQHIPMYWGGRLRVVDPVDANEATSKSYTDALAATKISQPTGAIVDLTPIPTALDNTWRYQQASYSQDNIVTLDDGTIYAVWIDSPDIHPIVGKLAPGSATWEMYDLRDIAGNPFGTQSADGHNTYVLGVGTDGNIHVAGNMHGVALKYAVTTTPGDITTFTTGTMVGTDETSVTYPNFVLASDDTLYFVYRSGTSGQGNVIVNEWNGTTWTRVAKAIDGDASLEGPYINHVAPDHEGGLHFMFTWRELSDAATNTDICYVRYTGSSWVKSDGTAQTMPVTHANAEIVIDMPQESGLINQTGLDVDTDGNPHGVFMWYDADDNTQYYHVWHDGTSWETEQVSNFTDRVETIGGVSTLNLVVARPQIICTSAGKVYVLGRAESVAQNRPIIIDVLADGHPATPLFDMDLTTWEPAYDMLALRRDDMLRMLITDLDSPASANAGYNNSWGGILSVDLKALPFIAASAPVYGAADAGRLHDSSVRGSLVVNTDLSTLIGLEHIGDWLMGTGITLVNQPAYGVTRPAMLTVTKPHRTVTHQSITDAEGQVFVRNATGSTWTSWVLASPGTLGTLANGSTLSALWHGDYLLSSGGGNAYPGEPADFAALNVAGVLEVRLIASTTSGTKFYRLTSFDRTQTWEATYSSGAMSSWLKTVNGGTPTYIQSTDPAVDGPYAWWDTSGGNLTLWIEDGV